MSEELTVVNTEKIDSNTLQLAQQIINEDDIDTVKDLTHLFNLNQAKKNVLRVMKLNGLLDTVSDKILDRFEKYPDNFSNADLLNYLQVTQNAIEKANKNLSLVDETPVIQLQQNNQVNVNIIDTLDRDSKARVLDTIKAILSNTQSQENTEEVITLIQEDSGDENV
jgi:hypothetical protein